ncbi:DNA-binding domain-containing protein [Legionella londiniensis]|uniref:Putative DNA-binding domain-containing protein n=1 Tax=Legionella londiniensis TaxID=45068 RepID=A0A0W0VS31_9GAMM|nr:DNA-binding domain-containing protein [Legionella londiniensis]KTD22926.1 hypothetical protein Llon_0316 [Legionella londiniensis]STX92966.1 Uncharacterized protein conserved in bacteria [Legionella londiniensis]
MLLRELQCQFKESIFNKKQLNLDAFISKKSLPAERLLQIYRNNCFINLTEALESIYPTVLKLVGENFFSATAKAYILAHPSVSGNLHDFGELFSSFLQEFPPAQPVPYLPEVAQLEWGAHRIYHEEDSKPLDVQELSKFSEDESLKLKFQLKTTSRLFSFKFPIYTIHQFCHKDNEDAELTLKEEGESVLITRDKEHVCLVELTRSEYAFLSALEKESELQEACLKALTIDECFDVQSILQKHLILGTFCGIYL